MRLKGGFSLTTFSDGHAATVSQGKMFEKMDLGDGTQAYKLLWPNK